MARRRRPLRRLYRKMKRTVNTTTRKVLVAGALVSGGTSPATAAYLAPDSALGQLGASALAFLGA